MKAEAQLFGNLSQGYSLTDIGGFTRRAGLNLIAEICDAYEAGLRGDWGKARAGLSGYLSTSKDGVNYDVAANRVSQQKERIWGVEAHAEYDINAMFTIGGVLGYVEGKYDANHDGSIGSDEYLPNNRTPSNWTGLAYVNANLGQGFRARARSNFSRDAIASPVRSSTARRCSTSLCGRSFPMEVS